MNTAASQWSRHQLAKDFDNPKATYDSLRRTISDAFKDAEIKNINVDEIFPLRTGQLTIGKGSGSFNNLAAVLSPIPRIPSILSVASPLNAFHAT